MVFSPTSLEDYATCPRKYYYKAVLGLDEGLFANLLADRLRRNNSKQTLSPLEQGTLAHALLEQLDFTQSPNEQRKLCKQISWQLLQEGSAEPTEVINAVLAFAGSAIGKTLAKMRLRREAPFIARFRGSADFHITGAIDLIAEDDHRLIVYDYKYVEPGTNLDGYRFQLATYMLALSDSYPHRKVEGSLVFLRGGHQEPVIFNREFFRGQLLFLMEEIRLHQHELDFGTIEGCNGSSCPFYSRCISQPGKTAKKSAKVSLAITP
jgi:ATP-dependent exoDNAse (exonuclease V) beta subunit